MTYQAFVYTELQKSVPFEPSAFQDFTDALQRQPGFIDKTWLAGVGNQSLGGFYTFARFDDALTFANQSFPALAKQLGVAQTSLVFDRKVVEEASIAMNSPHFGQPLPQAPGAFVYTEVQLSVPFADAPWRQLNPVLQQQPGLLAKTWLSGHQSGTVGGFYAFADIASAQRFATDYFPGEAQALNAAYTTRIFDAALVGEASRQRNSPYFTA